VRWIYQLNRARVVWGDKVIDPCTGRGLTAMTAAEMGRVFTGTELNPRRAAITLQKLAQLDYPIQEEAWQRETRAARP